MVSPLRSSARLFLILAPLCLLLGDVLQILEYSFAFTIVLWISFVLFVPVALALAYLGVVGGRTVSGYTGGILAATGAIAGATMQGLFRAWFALDELGHTDMAAQLQEMPKLLFSTQVPGILFPIGLLILTWGLLRTERVASWSALLLGAGAILFPVGHAAGVVPALLGGDIILLAACTVLVRYFGNGNISG